jgi:hypothetical protein
MAGAAIPPYVVPQPLASLALYPPGTLPQNPPAAPASPGNPTQQETLNAIVYVRKLQIKRGQYTIATLSLCCSRSIRSDRSSSRVVLCVLTCALCADQLSDVAVTAAELLTAQTFALRLLAERGGYGPGVAPGVAGLTAQTWQQAQNDIAANAANIANVQATMVTIADLNVVVAPINAQLAQIQVTLGQIQGQLTRSDVRLDNAEVSNSATICVPDSCASRAVCKRSACVWTIAM